MFTPVLFSKEHKNMLAHRKEILEYNNGTIAFHHRFNKLVTSLRTAVENGEGMLVISISTNFSIWVITPQHSCI